jgi:hypothetical protein
VVPDRFRHQRNHGTHIWMADRCAQHLMRIGEGPVTVAPASTRGAVNRLSSTIRCAIEG